MPGTILTSSDLDVAFTFSRSESAAHRDSTGALVMAAADEPRLDHDAAGRALGLLVTSGADIGGQDRVAIDPLILPEHYFADELSARAATVFHCYDPGTGEVLRAVYSRNVQAAIDALLATAGHHKQIGVAEGFLPNVDGSIRFRGRLWRLPAALAAGAGVLATDDGRPLIECGAEPV